MKKLNRVGEKHVTNEGYEIEVIEYFGCENCTIRFKSGLILTNILYASIKKRQVSNPEHLSKYGVGFLGIGPYTSKINGKATKYYQIWSNITTRCYNTEYHKKYPTYSECLVAKKWHNFQNYAKWHEENYIENYVLDKDILVKGNKIYSPETCCFVPMEVNALFIKSNKARGKYPIGVWKMNSKFAASINKNGTVKFLGLHDTQKEAFAAYKVAKECFIKEVAEKWRYKITENVYDAMMNYNVEITD